MAADSVVDGDYLGAYSRFFAEFVARVNPHDQLPVKVSAYDINESELVGEIIRVTLQYLNQTECPPSLQSYIVHLVIQAIKSTCKKQPEICGLRQQEKTYAPLKLMQAVTNEVNEICRRYLDNSRLALLPPPSLTPQVSMGATRNVRRKMEDRHVVLHDLHTIFNIQDNTIANYYAVFDGHGGQDAAVYCATHLHRYLVESVHYPTDPESALRDAFLTADAQFITKSNTQKLNGGTTAVCALILNKKLYIAWVGDSMASLVTRNQVKQLVNPHRPTREDETKRIIDLGGVVVHCMGVLRVNGLLSISRAIGDVSYKPYISGEPEVRCVSLNGNEDFLIIACDGLWDYVDQKSAAQIVYRQVLQNPHDLKYVHQALLHSAKYAGSLDNITVIVVFLSSPIEIALRHQSLTHQTPNGLLLNNIRMDPNNPISSNFNESDADDYKHNDIESIYSISLDSSTEYTNFGANVHSIGFSDVTKNGRMDSGGNDDYDYVDLGPETDVDAVDDPPLATSSSREPSPGSENMPGSIEEHSTDDNNDNNLNRADVGIDQVEGDVKCVGSSDRDIRGAEDTETSRDTGDDTRVESTGMHTTVEDDESPSLPQAARTPPDALIPETENVADSEDSEDEWNYYRIDPNKKESAATPASEESCKDVEEQSVQEHTDSVKEDSSEIQSSQIQSSGAEDDIKCEGLEKSLSELVSIDTSDEGKRSELEQSYVLLEAEKQEQDNKSDMDFQLNPEAAEFVPSSPPLLGNKSFLDYPISGSPLKQTPMDDFPVPSQSEFEQEVCHRPREIDEHFSSDKQHMDRAVADSQQDNACSMDESEVSSTKAEMGDDSMTVTMSATQWQVADVSSQSVGKTRDDSEDCDLEEYDVVNKSDLMATSFTADNLEMAFEKSVDLNAVHDLNESSEDVEPTDSSPLSPEPCVSEERTHTPFSDKDKDGIDLLCMSSTPLPTDEKLVSIATLKSEEVRDMISAFKADSPSMEQSGISDLVAPAEHVTELTSNESKFTSDESKHVSDEFKCDQEESVVSSERNDLIANEGQVDDNSQLVENQADDKELDVPSSELESPLIDTSLVDTRECEENTKLMEKTETIDKEIRQEEEIDKEIRQEEKTDKEIRQEEEIDKEIRQEEEIDKEIRQEEEIDKEVRQEEEIETATQKKSEKSLFDSTWKKLEEHLERHNFAEETAKLFGQREFPTTEKDAQRRLLDEPVVPDTLIESSIHLPIEHSEQRQSVDWLYTFKDDRPLLPSRENYPKLSCLSMHDKLDKENKSEGETDSSKDDRDPSDLATKLDDPKLSKQIVQAVDQQQQGGLEVVNIPPSDISAFLNSNVETQHERKEEEKTEQEDAEIIPADIAEEFDQYLNANYVSLMMETNEPQKSVAVLPESVAKEKSQEVATTVATVVSPTKTKTTTTTTAKRPKTITKATTPTTKTATKISPTSPSKAVSTARTTTTQSATAKKSAGSTAARPKQLDGSTKAMVSSVGGTKQTVTKTTITAKTATTATKTTASPRIGTTKPKTITATSPKPSGTSIEKKLTTNGDAKSATKSVTAKSAVPKTTTSSAITKTTLVKSQSTTTRTSTPSATSKSRPTSAVSAVKTPTLTSKQLSTGTTTSVSRPKTAPPTGAAKLRESISKTTLTKSPLGDKQSKETSNKQVSRSGLSTAKTGGRNSAPTGITGTAITAKPRTSLGKSSALSPTKKSSLTGKITSRTDADTKSISSSVAKQNGVPQTMKEVDDKIIERLSGSEDEIPQKDTSPVNVSTDNQLLVD